MIGNTTWTCYWTSSLFGVIEETMRLICNIPNNLIFNEKKSQMKFLGRLVTIVEFVDLTRE